jgi:anti-anti-sigma regulatory factor
MQPDEQFILPASLDLTGAETLQSAMQALICQDAPLTIDASLVERAGTPGLQVLVASAAAARLRGLPFNLATPSAALLAAARDLGLAAALGLEPV